MTRTLTIHSARCIRPASGIDGFMANLFDEVTKLVPEQPLPAHLVVLVDKLFAGQDDFYMKLSGTKIYPVGHKYKALHSQETAQIDVSAQLTKPLSIELWEYDLVSADDFMGRVTVQPTEASGKHTRLVASKAEGSLYQITYSVA